MADWVSVASSSGSSSRSGSGHGSGSGSGSSELAGSGRDKVVSDDLKDGAGEEAD